MGIKKKLGLGVASAALGVSLVGGGTWAAFNDVEKLSANYAAGVLDLAVGDITSTGVNLSNLKPGDKFEKEFELDAVGTLAIKDVLLRVKHSGFQDYTKENAGNLWANVGDKDIWGYNSAEEFLSQFNISVLKVGAEGGNGHPINIVENVNLLDFISMTNGGGKPALGTVSDDYYDPATGRVNVITKVGDDGTYHGLPVDPNDTDKVKFVIEFEDHNQLDANGLQVQNKYQGDSITLDFQFEARQWDGLEVAKAHVNDQGYISQNEKSYSQGDGSIPVIVKPEEPKEITVTGVQIKNDWSWGLFSGWTVKAQIEFQFSDGHKVKSNTENVKNANPNGQTITFNTTYKGKPYSVTETFKR